MKIHIADEFFLVYNYSIYNDSRFPYSHIGTIGAYIQEV